MKIGLDDRSETEFDVLVVGGGPSGLSAASFLVQSGLSVALFEQDSEIGKDVVCSGVISKEAFSEYDLPEEAIVGRLKEADLVSPGGRNIPYSHPEEAVVVVDRHIFDGKLAERARGHGAHIYLGTRVSSISVADDFVEATLKTTHNFRKVKAEVAVIATGVSFNLQASLGLGRPKKIIKGIQVEVKAKKVERLRLFWGNRFSDGFFGWAIPLMDGRTRVGVITDGSSAEGLNNVLSEVGPYTDICAESGKVKKRGIAFGNISSSYADRVVAVGEAAGLVKTTTGGGIYYGILSAEMAARVIKKAFQKKAFQARALSEYERLWRNSLGKEIKFGEYFHRFYSSLGDDSIEALFDAAKKDDLLSFIAEEGKFDWHKDAVVKILKSPELRRVFWNGIVSYGKSIAL